MDGKEKIKKLEKEIKILEIRINKLYEFKTVGIISHLSFIEEQVGILKRYFEPIIIDPSKL